VSICRFCNKYLLLLELIWLEILFFTTKQFQNIHP
jgi:hypothetical protein